MKLSLIAIVFSFLFTTVAPAAVTMHVDLVSTETEVWNYGMPNQIGIFKFQIRILADGDDIYIPDSGAFAVDIYRNGSPAMDAITNTVYYNNFFSTGEIGDGEMVVFTSTTSVVTNTSGFYQARLRSVDWFVEDESEVNTLLLDTSVYRSDYQGMHGTSTPEPSVALLTGLGVIGLVSRRRR